LAAKTEAAAPFQVDPICGRKLADGTSSVTTEYKRRKYFFCSDSCRHAFEERTERFRLKELAQAGALLTPGKVRWGLA
jgi:YHS domain-containing protein